MSQLDTKNQSYSFANVRTKIEAKSNAVNILIRLLLICFVVCH